MNDDLRLELFDALAKRDMWNAAKKITVKGCGDCPALDEADDAN